MENFAQEDVREVLERYGVTSARRASDTDESEEVILVSEETSRTVNVDALTRALIDVLPHKESLGSS